MEVQLKMQELKSDHSLWIRIPELIFLHLWSSKIGCIVLGKIESVHHASLTGSVFSTPL